MNVFLGCPTHDGRIHYKTAQRIYDNASERHRLLISISQTSLLNWNCNQLWCLALNASPVHNIKWFAMLHSDVVPEAYWLDKLIDIAEKHNAAMLSVCIAIKDASGDVSAGISNPDLEHFNMRRLKLQNLTGGPDAFDKEYLRQRFGYAPDFDFRLLVNTGCMIVRVDQPWSKNLIFKSEERIFINDNQQYQSIADPEDWNFSRQVANYGRVMATTAIKADHIGNWAFPNYDSI